MIKLEHISKTFGDTGDGVHAVKDVSLEIGDGEIFGIIGFSGAGKSTLVRCINLLERPISGSITVNGRPLDDYFGLETLKLIVRQPFAATDTMGKFDVEATVTGGGVTGQAGAIRHGIARALLQVEDSYRAPLKAAGLLTRDPRMKERKKYGLKAARRAPQFSKR